MGPVQTSPENLKQKFCFAVESAPYTMTSSSAPSTLVAELKSLGSQNLHDLDTAVQKCLPVLQSTLQTLEQQLALARQSTSRKAQQVSTLTQQLSSSTDTVSQQQARIEALEQQLSKAQQSAASKSEQLTDEASKVSQYQSEVAALKDKLGMAAKNLKTLLPKYKNVAAQLEQAKDDAKTWQQRAEDEERKAKDKDETIQRMEVREAVTLLVISLFEGEGKEKGKGNSLRWLLIGHWSAFFSVSKINKDRNKTPPQKILTLFRSV